MPTPSKGCPHGRNMFIALATFFEAHNIKNNGKGGKSFLPTSKQNDKSEQVTAKYLNSQEYVKRYFKWQQKWALCETKI